MLMGSDSDLKDSTGLEYQQRQLNMLPQSSAHRTVSLEMVHHFVENQRPPVKWK